MADRMAAMVGVEDMSICEATTITGHFCISASSVMFLLVTGTMEVPAEAQEQMARTVTSMSLVAQSFTMPRLENTSAT